MKIYIKKKWNYICWESMANKISFEKIYEAV